MKTAKEMFEELGYSQHTTREYEIIYNIDHGVDCFYFPKRYKEKNKWQKEMSNIPGDTFLEKWHQAKSMKEKQILIMGSLSDIAKKPIKK